jgi:hypothetical protein
MVAVGPNVKAMEENSAHALQILSKVVYRGRGASLLK